MFHIRTATPDDAPTLVKLINDLAAYEKLSHESHPDVEALAKHLAPNVNPRCEALLAVVDSDDEGSGEIVGMALYFYSYSTFLTKWSVFLEDLFVSPDYRGKGIGFALLRALAGVAVEKGCERLDWNVLNWNKLAIDFYEQLGAVPQSEWTTMRLSGEALIKVSKAT